MTLFDYLKIASRALWSNKARSILTMLGVVIGVFSVITFLSIGEGLKAEVERQFKGFGSNLLIIVPGKVEGFESFGNTIGASTLSLKDVEAIKSQSNKIESVSPFMIVSAVVKFNSKTVPGPMVIGTDANLPQVQNMEFAQGIFFNSLQENQRARVAVLGGTAKERIFAQDQALGKEFEMLGQRFTVIGSLKKNESEFSLGGGGPEDFIYIPLPTAQELTKSEQIARLLAKALSSVKIEEAQNELKNIILANHGGSDDFSVLRQDELLDLFNNLFGKLTTAVSGIGAISLLVGGIGIMNIMFVSVTERTREIGLRKAVGATNANILLQFLTEATILSLIGGGLGVVGAYVVTFALKKAVNLPATITWQSIILAAGISIAVGVIFGIVPAFRASRKNSIEALRYE